MLRFNNLPGNCIGYLVDDVAQLPRIAQAETLYLDTETTSGDSRLSSTNPWFHCSPIGFALTFGDAPIAYFVPWKLSNSANQSRIILDWLAELLRSARNWVNHNIKYDAHVIENLGTGTIPAELPLVCTLMQAHLIHSDRTLTGGYGLDALVRDWCGVDILPYYERTLPYTKAVKNQDYGRIPLDILAEYACADVCANRLLHKYCNANMPQECKQLEQTEIALTRVLLDTERNGLRLEPTEVRIAAFKCYSNMLEIEDKIEKIVGRPFNPKSTDDCRDLICNQFGQPVISWTVPDADGNPTAKSNPSFDKDALLEYRERVETPPKLADIVELILQYREETQHASLFYEPWQTYAVPERSNESLGLSETLVTTFKLHGSYNQNVRSGRMSCAEPNEQQLDKTAKALIRPSKGYVFVSFDYSQIEYRLICHYIDDENGIAAYAADPGTDFHDYVAELCSMDRKPAKTMNFMMAFGGGKMKTQQLLARQFNKSGENLPLEDLEAKARSVYNTYHRNLPTLKATSQRAASAARQRGYVRNIAGRHLHLPSAEHNVQKLKDGRSLDRCHIALNRVVQSSASDIAKERAVAVQPLLRRLSSRLVALVHDEFLIEVPEDMPEFAAVYNEIRDCLEATPFPLKVKLRAGCCWSGESWADCEKNQILRAP